MEHPWRANLLRVPNPPSALHPSMVLFIIWTTADPACFLNPLSTEQQRLSALSNPPPPPPLSIRHIPTSDARQNALNRAISVSNTTSKDITIWHYTRRVIIVWRGLIITDELHMTSRWRYGVAICNKRCHIDHLLCKHFRHDSISLPHNLQYYSDHTQQSTDRNGGRCCRVINNCEVERERERLNQLNSTTISRWYENMACDDPRGLLSKSDGTVNNKYRLGDTRKISDG